MNILLLRPSIMLCALLLRAIMLRGSPGSLGSTGTQFLNVTKLFSLRTHVPSTACHMQVSSPPLCSKDKFAGLTRYMKFFIKDLSNM